MVNFSAVDLVWIIGIVVLIVSALRKPAFWFMLAVWLVVKPLGLSDDNTFTLVILLCGIIGIAAVASVWEKTKRAFAEGKGETDGHP